MVAVSAGRLCLGGRGRESWAGDRHLPLKWSPGSCVPCTPRSCLCPRTLLPGLGARRAELCFFSKMRDSLLASPRTPRVRVGGMFRIIECSRRPCEDKAGEQQEEDTQPRGQPMPSCFIEVKFLHKPRCSCYLDPERCEVTHATPAGTEMFLSEGLSHQKPHHRKRT